MKVKAMCAFKSKLLKPCKKLLLFFRLKTKAKKKPFSIRRAIKFHAHNKSKSQKSFFTTKPIMPSFLSVFHSPKKSKDMDKGMLQGLKSPSNMLETPIFPSPVYPAYASAPKAERREDLSREVEDACRSFENYLVEMIVEEGKTKDLMDVEELLYCWKNLKCPVFIDLVCRFYGELCKDLFSSDTDEEYDSSK